jgi:hypothetical protein
MGRINKLLFLTYIKVLSCKIMQNHAKSCKIMQNQQESYSKNNESEIQSSPLLPSIGHLFACSTDECCLEMYQVCIANGVRTVTLLSGMTETPECPQFCEPVCDGN